MRFGVSIPPFADPLTLVEIGVAAEAAGWDAVLFWDHLRFSSLMDPEVHDPWALLSALAVRTQRVLLGTCVTPLARRRPQVLAKQIVTLDHLSHGRALLGVGLGEPPDVDFSDWGDDPDTRVRGARLDESLAILDALLTDGRVDHDGAHFKAHGTMRPTAVQRPRPRIFVAGVAPHRRPLQRALRWDGFFPIGSTEFLTPDLLAAYVGDVERPPGWELYAARAPGFGPDEFEAAGADWLVDGAWPEEGWVDELRTRVEAGPQR